MNNQSVVHYLTEMQAVKGLNSMKAILRNFAKNCVDLYTHYDNDSLTYHISINDLPDFVQQEFASHIMSYDRERAEESIGSDNNHFDYKLLPSLLNLLKSPTNKDVELDFIRIWRESITQYHSAYMQELLDEACEDKNHGEHKWKIYG